MISRREVVTGGVLGSLATGAVPEFAEAQGAPSDQVLKEGLKKVEDGIVDVKQAIDQGLRGNSMNSGGVGLVRNELQRYLKTSGKFPEYLDVGVSIFFDVYDWHVRQQQQIQISRMADQRMSIQFMFTQLVLRWENSEIYVGQAYDR